MSTTRHLINRQRRLATARPPAARTGPPRPAAGAATAPRPSPPRADAMPETEEADGTEEADRTEEPAAAVAGVLAVPAVSTAPRRAPLRLLRLRRAGRPSRLGVVVALLAVLTVLLGGFAAWAAGRASDLRDSVAAGNTALTDTARTSEVKGMVAQDVNEVFSYDYADTARTDTAARRVLTGRAVQQYATMIAAVRAQAGPQKLVLTTTVTDTGVVMIDGDRARVLVYADQRNTSTGRTAGTTYAAAMFTVDAVRQSGTWKIAAIDTFG